MVDPRKDEPADKPYVVHWEATVYGCTVVKAPTEQRAIEKANEDVFPTRDAEDSLGDIKVMDVYRE